MTLVLIETYQ